MNTRSLRAGERIRGHRTSRPRGSGWLVAAAAGLGFLLANTESGAVPADPRPAAVRQPDGDEITLRLLGDEHFHWHEDDEGHVVVRASDGTWVYAREQNRRLVPSAHVVGRADPAALGFPPPDLSAIRGVADRPAPPPTERAPTSGTMFNLVLLVNFADLTIPYVTASYDSLFNTIDYADDGANGSVRDYYDEVSYGALSVVSTVVEPVTVSQGYAYYGVNGPDGWDLRPREMVEEALAVLESRGFDFGQLDFDGDGWLDGLTVLHAGGGEEYPGNDPDYIWSHYWSMNRIVTYDGIKMQHYHTEPARRGYDSSPPSWGITRIGVICHENGHFLGLPDLYDYDYDSMGVGDFCLMASGSWNGSGVTPAHFSAWCKATLGWVSPGAVTAAGSYPLDAVETSGQVWKLHNSFAFPPHEYFLLENRQGIGFDSAIPGPGRGILIWHVDESQPNNDDQTHYLVDLEEASGVQHLELNGNQGTDADYFRFGHVSAFTSATAPDNLSYAGLPLGFDVTWVSETGTSMSFLVTSPSGPRTWFIQPDGSGAAPTIQAAIDSAGIGDIISLADGIYTGDGNRDLDFGGKPITVRSQSGNPDVCILDAGGSPGEPHRGFVFGSSETSAAVLKNVTVTGGYATDGAGILCTSSSPLLKGCILRDNTATTGGAAIHCEASSPTIRSCTIVSNASSTGGVVRASGGSHLMIERSILAFNLAGGAASCVTGGTVTLSCSDVYGNVGGDWTGCIADQAWTMGNFSDDPRFCDLAGGSHRLGAGSPCIEEYSDCGVLAGALGPGCFHCDEVAAYWRFDGSGLDESNGHPCTLDGSATYVFAQTDYGLYTDDETEYATYSPPFSTMIEGQIAFEFRLADDFVPDAGYSGVIGILASDRAGDNLGDASVHLDPADGRLCFAQETTDPGGPWTLRTNQSNWTAGVWYLAVIAWSPSGREMHVTWEGGSDDVADAFGAPCFAADATDTRVAWRAADSPSTGLTIDWMEVCGEIVTSVLPPGGNLPIAQLLWISPNPCRGRVEIRYDLPATWLPHAASFDVSVFDVTGRRVRTFRPEPPAGTLVWDGRDSAGGQVASGVYFVRLSTAEADRTRRLLLVR